MARQHLIDGSVDIQHYRQEVLDAETARVIEEADVPPAVDRAALYEKSMVVAQEAAARFYDRAIVGLEEQQSAWTPATLEQLAGDSDDDAV